MGVAERDAQRAAHAALLGMQAELNRVYTLEVVVKSQDPAQEISGLQAALPVGVDPELWAGKTDEKGVWKMRFTALGYLQYAAPGKVRLTAPRADGSKEELEAPLELKRGTTRVVFQLGSFAGSYQGRLLGRYGGGPGVDGPVKFDGPIKITVRDNGAATASFTMPVQFGFGYGRGRAAGTAGGKLEGQLTGEDLKATGSVTTKLSFKGQVPGMNRNQGHTASVRILAKIQQRGTTPVLVGKLLTSGGGTPLKFEAPRTGP
jgi:hypothetical protein